MRIFYYASYCPLLVLQLMPWGVTRTLRPRRLHGARKVRASEHASPNTTTVSFLLSKHTFKYLLKRLAYINLGISGNFWGVVTTISFDNQTIFNEFLCFLLFFCLYFLIMIHIQKYLVSTTLTKYQSSKKPVTLRKIEQGFKVETPQ